MPTRCSGRPIRWWVTAVDPAWFEPTAEHLRGVVAATMGHWPADAPARTRSHAVEQRFCRWLLMGIDLLHSDRMRVTHEQISHLLGIRRESVSQTAGQLQKDGLITVARGSITVLHADAAFCRAAIAWAQL